MSLEKTVQKIRLEMEELKPALELFTEDGIQPLASDCEDLQRKLAQLQENLAVYKYLRLNHEVSPSFNLHAKLSSVQQPEEKKQEPVAEIKQTPVEKEPPVVKPVDTRPQEETPVPPVKTAAPKTYPHLAVNLNDKFRFINELFAQNSSEYNIALEQLNNLQNWHDTEIYLNSLKNLYEWNDQSEMVKHFYALIKKRFH